VNKNKIHDSIRLMADIIVELLDGSTIVKDFIFLVINENHDHLAYYLNMHDIPHPKEDVLTFAKRNRKKLRKQRIIEVDNPEDEIESEHLEDEQSSIDNEDKQQEDDVIKVNQ